MSKILRPFGQTLTPGNRNNLTPPIEMQLYKKLKAFLRKVNMFKAPKNS